MKANKLWLFLCLIIPFLSFAGDLTETPLCHHLMDDGGGKINDTLPSVFPKGRKDVFYDNMRKEAEEKFNHHKLPTDLVSWKKKREVLRNTIIQKNNVQYYPDLPFDLHETSMIQLDGYKIKNIFFQTRPNLYATANLFIPEGKGYFPAVLVMMGHSSNGKISDIYQSLGHLLALNGYVALLLDPWGQGERTTIHKEWEYHGADRGASLLNVGETLMGMLLTDNIRAVDLLSSLPYVDAKNIGATGSSGGGGQTMWLTAIEERIKAAVPVVSVGTIHNRVMNTNCVCEMMLDGLTFTETSGVLGLVAPRAIKMCNHYLDGPTFHPREMRKSFHNAKPIFELYHVPNNIDSATFDFPHGYKHEDKEVMLGWFDLHLRGIGDGSPKKVPPFEYILRENRIMVFDKEKRDERVVSTIEYTKQKGLALRDHMLNQKNIAVKSKKNELKKILRLNENSKLKKIQEFGSEKGWDKLALETSDNKLIPLLHIAPDQGVNDYIIITSPKSKAETPGSLINQSRAKGAGIVVVDLLGIGEAATLKRFPYPEWVFHNEARAHWLLGKTMMGEWVQEINLIADYLKVNKKAQRITIEGFAETGIAALFSSVLDNNVNTVVLHGSPISYLTDSNEGIGHFSMATHIPGFLNWGDVSLATALSGSKEIIFYQPVTMSGNAVNGAALEAYKAEYERLKNFAKLGKEILFSQ